MKKHLLTIVMLTVTAVLMAAPVSQQETERIANFFFHEHGGRGDLHYVENSKFSHLHFYSGENGRGFVIMSADDCVLPILGYSAGNELNITDMGPNTRYWLEEYERQIEWNIKNGFEVSTTVTDVWSRLGKMIPQPQQALATNSSYNTANLLTTTWSQRPYYNRQCPYDSQEGEYTLTGCVATAMGQIMKYWEFPIRGIGSYTYTDPYYGLQSADFSDTVFDYSAMPNKLNSYSTASQVDAVALLLRRCGIAAEMYYGVEGSSATTIGSGEIGDPTAENAYREYFKFMHTLHSESLSDYTDSAWVALLKNEIDNGRPAQYSAGNEYTGGGHSFICSGYDNTGKLYFNWGWNGNNDGYFQIGQLNPGSSYYNARNKAIIGIEPDTSGSSQTTITLVPNIQGAGTMYGAGTYTSYQDTVTMLATANAGYLFDCWDDNLHYNPYQFLANGGNITHTANFVKMTGDTLGYCRDANISSYGGSSVATRMWAIRLDSNSIAPRRKLTHVQAYISEEGNYKVHIFQGATANSSTLVLSDTLNIPSSQDETWVDIELSTPVNVNKALPLWIALETRGSGYPKSYSAYMGNIDGAWSNGSNFDEEWDNYVTDYEIYLTWQIRGVFAEREMQNFEVTVVSDNTTMGTVTGGGTYPEDTTITIKAIPNEGYHFVKWQDDNTDSVRMIVVNDNLTFTAFFEEDEDVAVDNVSVNEIHTYTDGKHIIIENATGREIRVYDATGKLVASRRADSNHTVFNVVTGVYFIRIEGETLKVVVK
ncbi:MAG: C10 family peptidase [Paludibacteraceae bacterium]|nr:C10 family peptidase [Paludibacteraceae bacterium]